VDDVAEGWGAACAPAPMDPVRIRQEGTKRLATVMGYRFGAWAVHRAVPVDGVMTTVATDAWAVSHVPTGMAIGWWLAEPTFWDAVRVALALHDSHLFPDAHAVDASTLDESCCLQAVIGAALQDHYVFPVTEAHHG